MSDLIKNLEYLIQFLPGKSIYAEKTLTCAIAALRDAQARQEGCERCTNGMERFLNTAWWSFCPWCGRALNEPVGNADTLPTAEHSSGVEEPNVSKTERVDQKGPEPGGEGKS